MNSFCLVDCKITAMSNGMHRTPISEVINHSISETLWTTLFTICLVKLINFGFASFNAFKLFHDEIFKLKKKKKYKHCVFKLKYVELVKNITTIAIDSDKTSKDKEMEINQLKFNFETKIKGLYVLGDGSGVTHSLSQAAASGVYVAGILADKYNGYPEYDGYCY